MKVKFLESKNLEEGAHVSEIEVFEDRFYFIGGDGLHVQVTDKDWKATEEFRLNDQPVLNGTSGAAKNGAAVLVKDNKQPALLLLKSGSGDSNDSGALMNMKTRSVEKLDLATFYNRLRQAGISNLDIESASVVSDKIVLCNRGASVQQENESRLVFTTNDFWKKQANADIFKAKIEWEQLAGMNLRITALTYSYENDWLILTATSDRKPGEGESGVGFDSYLGIIENAYRKSDRKRIKINEAVNLAEVNDVFLNQRIESLSIQADKKDKLKLNLVSSNEAGETMLTRVRLKG